MLNQSNFILTSTVFFWLVGLLWSHKDTVNLVVKAFLIFMAITGTSLILAK
jgi:hypothetical protein